MGPIIFNQRLQCDGSGSTGTTQRAKLLLVLTALVSRDIGMRSPSDTMRRLHPSHERTKHADFQWYISTLYLKEWRGIVLESGCHLCRTAYAANGSVVVLGEVCDSMLGTMNDVFSLGRSIDMVRTFLTSEDIFWHKG